MERGLAPGRRVILMLSGYPLKANSYHSFRAVMRDADIVMVAASLNKFPFSFATVKQIRKPADLIDKKIGTVGLGD